MVPGYEYDIFISYSHVDNGTVQSEQVGWVEQFHKSLELKLIQRFGRADMVHVWRDKKLDGGQLFNDVIQNRINGSALFLSLTSPGYVESDYCQQELKWFHQRAETEGVGLRVGERMRIFNVLLHNIPYAEWLEAFGQTSGFPFYDAEDAEDFGVPLDPAGKEFETQIRQLVKAIFQALTSFPEPSSAPTPSQEPAEKPEKPQPQQEGGDVYVAQVADSLQKVRKRVISELNQKGITVHKRLPPPFEAEPHQEAVIAAMKSATLSVHLLDSSEGMEIGDDEETTYPQKQAQLGLEHASSQLIWVPRGLSADTIEDEHHKTFLAELENGRLREQAKYDFIRGGPNEIVREITEKLEQVKRAVQPTGTPTSVLLDTHLKDQMFAHEMSRLLLEKNIVPYVNPEEDDPRQNVQILQARLKQVGALVIFFGEVGEEWVRARLAEAAKIVITEQCPVQAFFVCLAPLGEEKDKIRFEQPFLNLQVLDNRQGLQLDALSPLLQLLGAGGPA